MKGLGRIIVCGIAAVLLVSLLVFGLTYDGSFNGRISIGTGGMVYPNEESYTIGSGSVQGELCRIEINWVSGAITISPYDGDEIILRETGVAKEADRLRFRLSDGTLTVQFRESGYFSFHTFTKDLEILIPRSQTEALTGIEIDTAASPIHLTELTAYTLDVDTASGFIEAEGCAFTIVAIDSASADCSLTNCTVGSFDMDTASGDVRLTGKVENVNFDSASGNLYLDCDAAPRAIDVDTASGRCNITIPADSEFTAELDSLSGRLTVNGFPGAWSGSRYGTGGSRYEFDSASGSVTIQAKSRPPA